MLYSVPVSERFPMFHIIIVIHRKVKQKMRLPTQRRAPRKESPRRFTACETMKTREPRPTVRDKTAGATHTRNDPTAL